MHLIRFGMQIPFETVLHDTFAYMVEIKNDWVKARGGDTKRNLKIVYRTLFWIGMIDKKHPAFRSRALVHPSL